jgi:hypothetical protein
MGGLVMYDMQLESQTTIPTQPQAVYELWTLTLGYANKKGFQQTWQIRLDNMGKVQSVSLM